MIFILTMIIYLAKKVQITSFVTKKVKILAKYSDLSDVFLEKKVLVLLEIIDLNKYAIKI